MYADGDSPDGMLMLPCHLLALADAQRFWGRDGEFPWEPGDTEREVVPLLISEGMISIAKESSNYLGLLGPEQEPDAFHKMVAAGVKKATVKT